MTIIRSCTVAFLFFGILAAQAPAPNVFEPVRFFLGSWEGDAKGQPGSGKSVREYRFVLENKFVEVRNRSTWVPQPKFPQGEVHEDWGMISYDRTRKKLVLRQFHVEGFVNQYAAEPSRDGIMNFVSESIENIPAGYRARESYRIISPDEFVERFELAEPGKDFELYSETHFKRKK